MTVAVVEDEAGVRDAVTLALEDSGYTVTAFADGMSAWQAWERGLPDLAVLDIIMPRMDGLELCRRLRARSLETPVIFLSSRDEEIDRVVGLELGADDYLCKPFSVRELVARVRALERRLRLGAQTERGPDGAAAGAAGAPGLAGTGGWSGPSGAGAAQGCGQTLTAGPLRLDLAALRVWWHELLIPLTVTEFRLLEVLVRNADVVLSRERLLRAAYPEDVYVTERSIDSHIRRIRRKFEDSGVAFEAVTSVYGAGYRFQEPATHG